MDVTVRVGRQEDWPAIQRAHVEAGAAAWSHILDVVALATLASPERWQPGLGADVLVACIRDAVVGFIPIRASADGDAAPTTGEVDGFYTHPTVWGMGVGRLLMDAAVSRLRDRQFTEATLWTERRNHRASRSYERAGWATDGAVHHYVYGKSRLTELRYGRSLLISA